MGETEALRAAVEASLSRSIDVFEDVQREAIDYDVFLAHRAVYRVSGHVRAGGERLAWSLIEKMTEGPRLAVPYLIENGTREFDAYTSGLLHNLAPLVRAPRAYGAAVEEDGKVVLWLEDVRHDGPRPLDRGSILSAARGLGGLAGRWHSRLLSQRWLFTGWIDRHSQPEAVSGGLAALRRRHPAVVARLGDRLAAAERLVLAQPQVRAVLESLPRTLCHHDAVGANVFLSNGMTTLIDWESVGPGPVAADLASLLFSSVRRGDASASVVVPALDDAFAAYVEGIRAESSSFSIRDVRRGLDAAIALRWKLVADVADGIERGHGARRGSLADESAAQAVDELLVLVDVLLDSAERVLDS